MKITFPHLGNVYIIAKALLDDLGLEYVIPPFNNRSALEIGARYAPELACLPLKITIGNLIQAYDQGADTVLMAGGNGPCRFGYYSVMQKEILKDAGYDMDMIALEAPNGDLREFFRRIKRLSNGKGITQVLKIVKSTVDVAVMTDELEKLCFRLRPREAVKGSVERIYKSFRGKILNVKGSMQIKQLIKDTAEELLSIETDSRLVPYKIGIVGEIYTTIETSSSFNIQEKLGAMGAEVHREVTLSGWIIEHMIKKALHLPRDLRYAAAAKPYLGTMIGGHAEETIGNSIIHANDGFDGIIQIYPFSCMPEIVAQSILPKVESDTGIPIMTLIIDEMTGEAGYLTRVEAFMDLLSRRREGKAYCI